MGKKSIETFVGIFVLLGMAGVVFLALKAANLGSFSGADTYTLHGLLRQHRRAQGARAGAQRRRHGRPRRLDQARPEALPGRRRAGDPARRAVPDRFFVANSHLRPARRPVRRRRARRRGQDVGRGRQRQADPIGGGPGKPDQPVPLQQGGGCRAARPRRQRLPAEARNEMFAPARLAVAARRPAGRRSGGAGRLHDDPRGRAAGRASDSIPGRTGIARSSTSTKASTTPCSKPVATFYSDVVPQPVRRGVTNFFNNFSDAWSAINNMLQGKFELGFAGRHPGRHEHAVRPARHPRRRIGDGPRASLRGLRPDARPLRRRRRRLRRPADPGPVDGARRGGDRRSTGSRRRRRFFDGTGTQIGFTLLQIINTRADLLGATRVIDDISLDKYTFIRDAYLQRRRSLVFDGDVPETPDGARRGGLRRPPAPRREAPRLRRRPRRRAVAAPAPSAAPASTPR